MNPSRETIPPPLHRLPSSPRPAGHPYGPPQLSQTSKTHQKLDWKIEKFVKLTDFCNDLTNCECKAAMTGNRSYVNGHGKARIITSS